MPREYSHDILAPPEPGIFHIRLVKKGWNKVPARIVSENGLWWAEIDGIPDGPKVADPLRSGAIMRVWEAGTKIEQGQYDYALALKAWALKNAPTHPAANPRQPIDLTKLDPEWSL
jgi:hypothetical protein